MHIKWKENNKTSIYEFVPNPSDLHWTSSYLALLDKLDKRRIRRDKRKQAYSGKSYPNFFKKAVKGSRLSGSTTKDFSRSSFVDSEIPLGISNGEGFAIS